MRILSDFLLIHDNFPTIPALTLTVFSQVMEVDINGDGTIDFEEFLGMMKQKANEAEEEEDLKEAFKIFDRDKDGFIDMKELKKVANMLGATLTKDEVDEFMREADVVGFGQNGSQFIETPSISGWKWQAGLR